MASGATTEVAGSEPFAGRREDMRLVTGAGRYTDDWTVEGQAFAAFRRSDRAHARLLSVDLDAAREQPGVIAVVSGADLGDATFATLHPAQPPNAPPLKMPERPILARDVVRFVGEEIAVVIAETAAAARDAADLIDVAYGDLTPVVGFEAALDEDSPAIHDHIPGNLCFEFEYGDAGTTRTAFEAAHGTVSVVVESPRVAPTPMEVRASLVSYDEGTDSWDVWCAHQGGPSFGRHLAAMCGLAPGRIRVHMLDVGGAFGARVAPFPETVLLVHLARKLGRPIKWRSTRLEDFQTDNHGRAIRISGELAYDADGRFLAIRTDWLCDSGAYLASAGVLTNSINGRTIAAGVYRVDAFHGRHRQFITNTAPTNAYRGAGRPDANYVVERLVDDAAAELGIDPMEIRRRNLIPQSMMPYTSPTGGRFDCGDFDAVLSRARRHADWDGFAARREASKQTGRLRGIGCGMFIEPSGGGGVKRDQVFVAFKADGTLELHDVAGPSGQGHETLFPELVSRWLGVPAARIVLRAGDPAGPELEGSPAIGSRSATLRGSAFKAAAAIVVEKARHLAADMLGTNEDLDFADGTFSVPGTHRAVAMTEIVERYAGTVPHPLDSFGENAVSQAFPNGAHIVEVEVDADTGTVEVLRYWAVDDVGTVLNATLAEGQLVGGILQGAGHVFGEHCRYEPSDGQLLTASFMDYFMPRADLVPEIATDTCNVPSPADPLGAKGVGEAGTTGAMSACMNAVLNALRPVGVRHLDIPVTPSSIWSALQASSARSI